ncbi:MAG: gamma carbonic anhydrase family protein [Dehalococcoidia bacterium]|nr:gamma carbonic anhydrase family protein [Dehalococcoidia bacterium]
MIRTLGKKTPKVAATAWISEAAYVVGDVEIGEYTSVWPGVTIRADGANKVVIGNYCNIQEGAVVHGNGLVIEDYVTIGHCVVVHGDRIGTGSLLGNNCTFLNRSTIGKHVMVAANSVVLSGTHVPDNSFVTGVPGAVKRPVTQEQVTRMLNTAKSLVERAKAFKESGL